VHLGYSSNAYHRYSVLPYSLRPALDLSVATPIPWRALTDDSRPVVAAGFPAFAKAHGDVFTREVEKIGQQTLPHIPRPPKKKTTSPPTESLESSEMHGKVLTAAIAILEDGNPRTADQILEEAIQRNLVPPETTMKTIRGSVVEYIARWIGRGRKPQIVQGVDRLFRINEPPDNWPDIGTAKAWQKKYGPLAEVIKIMNEILGAGIDDEHQVVFVVTAAHKLTELESLRDQARNNSREQFKNAGDIEARGEEALVQAKSELAEKNDRQNAAVQESLDRLFSNREGLARLMEGFADYVYDFHNRSTTT